MNLFVRMAKFGLLVALGVAASGCVVLPYGAGHHHRRGGYLAEQSTERQPSTTYASREDAGRHPH